jgi:hypothetical protein
MTPSAQVMLAERRLNYCRDINSDRKYFVFLSKIDVLDNRQYDNWRLWVLFKFRQRAIGKAAFEIGLLLPNHIRPDQSIDRAGLRKAARMQETKTLNKHLDALAKAGPTDFRGLEMWPHPIRGTST